MGIHYNTCQQMITHDHMQATNGCVTIQVQKTGNCDNMKATKRNSDNTWSTNGQSWQYTVLARNNHL